jgi:hypothetical protein
MGERYARIPAHAVGCRKLSAADWRVLAAIALHADAAGQAYPGMTTIAALAGMRRSDVPRSIRRLEQHGILRRERRAHSSGSPDANLYALASPRATELQRVSAIPRTGRCPQCCGQVSANPDVGVSAMLRTRTTQENNIRSICIDRTLALLAR